MLICDAVGDGLVVSTVGVAVVGRKNSSAERFCRRTQQGFGFAAGEGGEIVDVLAAVGAEAHLLGAGHVIQTFATGIGDGDSGARTEHQSSLSIKGAGRDRALLYVTCRGVRWWAGRCS